MMLKSVHSMQKTFR